MSVYVIPFFCGCVYTFLCNMSMHMCSSICMIQIIILCMRVVKTKNDLGKTWFQFEISEKKILQIRLIHQMAKEYEYFRYALLLGPFQSDSSSVKLIFKKFSVQVIYLQEGVGYSCFLPFSRIS